MQQSNEIFIVGWSMFTLFLLLVVVYVIFFSLYENPVTPVQGFVEDEKVQQLPVVETAPLEEKNEIKPIHVGGKKEVKAVGVVAEKKDDTQQARYNQNTKKETIPSGQKQDKSMQNNEAVPTHIVSSQSLFLQKKDKIGTPSQKQRKPINPQQILYLAGTHHWVGVMKSAKFFGIHGYIQYILKNNDNTHFAYLGKELPNIADTLADLGGKSIALTNESDIHTHGLFGDKVIFLLVPPYIGKKQLFFVYFAEARDRWFIQVDNDIFETTKPLLRELFTKRYNR